MGWNDAAAARPAHLEPARGSAVAMLSPDAVVFDIESGMPLTRAAARSMGVAAIRSALGKAVESLPGRRAVVTRSARPAPGAAPALDSLEVVWLLSKFDKLFDKPLLDLTKVSAARWSTVEAVADLVYEAIGARA